MRTFSYRCVAAFPVICATALVLVAAVPGRSGVTNAGTSAPNATTPCGVAGTPPATYAHVIWILFENKLYSKIIGSSSAPYINGVAKKCGLATNYYAVGHPSLPDYIALTSGSTQGITDDSGPSSHRLTAASIFSQLGSGWRSLDESMPGNCYLSNSGQYLVRHNPAAYYTNIRTVCNSRDVPLGTTPDISARFTFVTPNACNDMHNCSISTGDKWLSTFLPKILNSSTYAAGSTAVFVTWDESDSSSSNRVPTLVISPRTAVGALSSTTFNHYSLLRTTESMLGLGCLAKACNAASMRSAFHL